jgi:hypothetical protein
MHTVHTVAHGNATLEDAVLALLVLALLGVTAEEVLFAEEVGTSAALDGLWFG